MSTTSVKVSRMKKVATLGKRKKSIDADDVKKIGKRDEFDPNQFYVSLTSHAEQFGVEPIRIRWGQKEPDVRGPIIGTNRHHKYRNAIGAHGGSYCIYRGLAVASGAIDKSAKTDLTHTTPAAKIGPHPSWADPEKIVTIDPFGACVVEAFPEHYQKGYDIRPTIAVTKAHMDFPEIHEAVRLGRLKPDGKILKNSSQLVITKAAIDPVWYLPGVAKRFNTTEANLRQQIFQETNGMYPELVTRNDLKVFLPPIGGLTIYIFGSVEAISDPTKKLAVRVHDECNGSDVFGSDICTCRPYLAHGIEVCVQTAQEGGAGIIVYFRKEGRALGEVTKYLVYNLRKRQEGGDSAEEYFNCTQTVAGIQDVRFQALMPDALHWLGITKIDKFVSMSDMKYDAIVKSGIEIVERIPIPEELVPKDAQVEITAKVFAGYNGGSVYKVDKEKLKQVKGRDDKEYEDSE
ncbi:GTP cyclohydrolase II [Phytophthora infestans]|uniref:GTP cyclohydrolase II n=1 Tax=Phytophthora infestans TaxID=4787 RepID=A0A833WH87_PHYIN|nr:GTP cyclohydrolase II [Phytophthora infestans]